MTSLSVQLKGRPLSRTTPSDSELSSVAFNMASASLFVTSYTETQDVITGRNEQPIS